jgi:phosphoribosylformylglycinamidine cyclo-ligase
MSVNDILVNGGKPLVFLDYLATEKIRPAQLEQILKGIGEGCKQSDCALIGGETAEMPGFYAPKEYDLAGFCVGVAEKEQMYPKKDKIQAGDVLIGLSSSGLHSNGFSLVRKIVFTDHSLDVHESVPELDSTLAETLLTPTRIYVKSILALLEKHADAIHAMVHVTGGGFYDNIPRVLSEGLSAELDSSSWTPPAVFSYLQRLGQLSNDTMWHTFNCGIGFILAVDASQAETVLHFLNEETDETAQMIGQLVATPNQSEVLIR